VFGRDLPTKMLIYERYKLLEDTGSIHTEKALGEDQSVAEAQLDTVCVASVYSPRKSTRHVAWQLNMPQTAVHKILQKHLKFRSCNMKLPKTKTITAHFVLTCCQA
jgi:hypothetical protein